MHPKHKYYQKKQIDASLRQDCQQRTFVGFEFLIELYRVVIGTCLIYFVPHDCSWTVSGNCGVFGNGLYSAAFYLNLATLGSFLVLYGIELKRENQIITYLEVNPLLGTDNEIVGDVMDKLDTRKRKSLYWVDTIYVSYAGYCLVCFGANTILSGIVLLKNAENNTMTGFITNILFMMTKLYRIHFVINTEKNIFYSSYLMNFVQFNDLDPKEYESYVKNTMYLDHEDVLWETDWNSVKDIGGDNENGIIV